MSHYPGKMAVVRLWGGGYCRRIGNVRGWTRWRTLESFGQNVKGHESIPQASPPLKGAWPRTARTAISEDSGYRLTTARTSTHYRVRWCRHPAQVAARVGSPWCLDLGCCQSPAAPHGPRRFSARSEARAQCHSDVSYRMGPWREPGLARPCRDLDRQCRSARTERRHASPHRQRSPPCPRRAWLERRSTPNCRTPAAADL